jgi:hypothetical protein
MNSQVWLEVDCAKLIVTPDLLRGPSLHKGIRPLLHVGCRNKPGMTANFHG